MTALTKNDAQISLYYCRCFANVYDAVGISIWWKEKKKKTYNWNLDTWKHTDILLDVGELDNEQLIWCSKELRNAVKFVHPKMKFLD